MAVEPKKVTGGAFGRFLAEHRAKLTQECAGKPATAVVKLASERFKSLSTTETARYQDAYAKAKKQYEEDLETFLAAGGEKKAVKRKADKLDKKGRKKQKKDADAPKKPAGGAYGCYLSKHREAFMKQCAGQPITAVSKLAGERWKLLTAEEKKPFEDDYATKKAAYQEAMKSYVPPARDEEDVEAPKSNKEIRKEEKEAAKAAKEEAKNEKIEAKEAAKKAKEEAKTAKKAKSPKTSAKKVSALKKPTGPELFPNVAAKADKAGLTEVLLKLVARDDIKESGKTQLQIFTALSENGGLLHPAKRALLGC